MKIKRVPQFLIVFLAVLVIVIGSRYTLTDNITEPEYNQIQESLAPPYTPIELGHFFGKTSEIGILSSYKIAASKLELDMEKRGYAMVICVKRTMMPVPEKYENVVLLDWYNNPVTYPLNIDESNLAYRLNEVLNSEEVFIRGELYNCSAWDDSWFLGLKVSNEKMYYIKNNPKPLDDTQFVITLDSTKYPPSGTAKISVWNWSEDWLNIDSECELFKLENGSWIQVQNYTSGDTAFSGIHMVFPGNDAVDELPLSHLDEGEYKVVKEIWRRSTKRYPAEAQFSIINPIQVDPQLIEDSPFNLFAFDLFNQLYKEGENLVFSPVSIHQVLGMIQEGARKETAEEMRQALHLPLNDTIRRETYKDNIESMQSDDDWFSAANAIWIENAYPILEEYRDTITTYFMGEARNIDYSNPELAREIINQWVSENTEGKITELLPPNSINALTTRLVLTNAVYFKGTWEYPFNENLTEPTPFRVNENKIVTVDMMKLTNRFDQYWYTNDSIVEMVKLPYNEGNLSIYIILPKTGTIEKTMQNLTTYHLNQLIDSIEREMIDIYLPRFQQSNEYKLKNYLFDLGIVKAFSDADLSGIIGSDGLFIAEVYHEAYIDVNEKGTEATAATGGVVALGGKHEPFRADHPFIYLIRDETTGTILFMGAVNDPTQ